MDTEYCINITVGGRSLGTVELPLRADEEQAAAVARKFAGRFPKRHGYTFIVQPSQKRVGLKPQGRQPVRAGAALFDADGNPAGHVTSGGFGPSASHPVAMGYATTALAKPATKLAEVQR